MTTRFALGLAVVVAGTACVPSYSFTEPSEGGASDGGATDAAPADAPADSADSAPGTVALDIGFPKTVTTPAGGDAGTTMTLSTTFDVPSGGRMLVAVVVWGQHAGSHVWPVSVAGGGLGWTSRAESVALSTSAYDSAVGAGVWTAWTDGAIAGLTVTATRNNAVPADGTLAVYSLAGASQTVGATGTTNGFGAMTAPLSVSFPSIRAGSFVALGLLDGDGANTVRGLRLATTTYDVTLDSDSGNGLRIGRLAATPTTGGPLTVGQDSPPVQYDVGAAVEIQPR